MKTVSIYAQNVSHRPKKEEEEEENNESTYS